jgi:hypothetical protein
MNDLDTLVTVARQVAYTCRHHEDCPQSHGGFCVVYDDAGGRGISAQRAVPPNECPCGLWELQRLLSERWMAERTRPAGSSMLLRCDGCGLLVPSEAYAVGEVHCCEQRAELQRLAEAARPKTLPWMGPEILRPMFGLPAEADFVGACSPSVILSLLAMIEKSERDTERLDWLEAHDYALMCYNVPTDLDSKNWHAPMAPNNGWIVSTSDDDDEDGRDHAGATAREAIDWAMKDLSSRAAVSQEGAP